MILARGKVGVMRPTGASQAQHDEDRERKETGIGKTQATAPLFDRKKKRLNYLSLFVKSYQRCRAGRVLPSLGAPKYAQEGGGSVQEHRQEGIMVCSALDNSGSGGGEGG